jgi:hypothetical protein
LLVGVDLVDLPANVVENAQRRSVGAHEDLREDGHPDGVGNVDTRLHRFAQSIIEGIAYYADDLQPIVTLRNRQGHGWIGL